MGFTSDKDFHARAAWIWAAFYLLGLGMLLSFSALSDPLGTRTFHSAFGIVTVALWLRVGRQPPEKCFPMRRSMLSLLTVLYLTVLTKLSSSPLTISEIPQLVGFTVSFVGLLGMFAASNGVNTIMKWISRLVSRYPKRLATVQRELDEINKVDPKTARDDRISFF